jgi:calcineurin-like phosphoesterase family protein
MDNQMIANWNSVVAPSDDIWHLGDFTCHADRIHSILERLNGKLHLVIGNHDFEFAQRNRRLASIQHYKELTINGRLYCLSHYPQMEWNGSFRGAYHLHGHSHIRWPDSHYRRLDVGVDGHDYRPWTVEEIQERFKHTPHHSKEIYSNSGKL